MQQSSGIKGSVRRIAGNAVSLLTSDVLNRATTFFLYAMVARYLGPFEFGQLSLALLLFYTFQVFAAAGFGTFITREAARDRTKTDKYLVNGSLTVLTFSLVSIIAQVLFVWLMDYDASTRTVILLLALGLIPYTLSHICEAIFQAWERMRYIAYANGATNVAKVVLSLLLLTQGYGVYALIILLVSCYVIILCIEWWLTLQYITRPRMKPDLRFTITMIKDSMPFLGMESIIAIGGSLNVLMLSKLESETEVGFYYAATQVLIPVNLVFQSLMLSIFPIMCRKFETGSENLKQIYENLVELLLTIALPSAIGLVFLAEPLLLLLYGDPDFLHAVGVLRIVAWGLIPLVFTRALGQVLLASMRERVTLRIVTINALLILILSPLLIKPFGITGAAVAGMITQIINLLQHYLPVSRLLSGIALGRVVWKSAVASLGMATYLSVVGTSLGLWLTMLTGALVYASSLMIVMVWANGGVRQFRARYLYLWSE